MKSIKKILIRGVNWLGDAVMTLPAIQTLLPSFPEVQLDVMTLDSLASLYSFIPGIRQVHSFQKQKGWKGIKNRFCLAQVLKKENYDACFIFPNSFDSALIPFMAGIPQRIGLNRNGRGFLLTRKISPGKNDFRQHHSLHYLAMVQSVIKEKIDCSVLTTSPAPLLSVSSNQKRNGLEILKILVPDAENSVLIGIAPGAEYGPAKKWPVERFSALCLKIIEKNPSVRILVFGTKKDQKDGELLTQLHPRVSDLTGKTLLKEFILILSLCRGVVTNDSGAMHLAGALGIPVVALFGSTCPEATKGLGPVEVLYQPLPCSPCFERECRDGETRCLTQITVETVWEKIQKWIPPGK
jgi:heptosyltransferase II